MHLDPLSDTLVGAEICEILQKFPEPIPIVEIGPASDYGFEEYFGSLRNLADADIDAVTPFLHIHSN